jgi:raffinose/stachyose/melibiose transport system permease protein
MMHRYTWRTAILEVVMIGTALIWVLPAYLLVNLAFRARNDPAPVLALPTEITFDNFTLAWDQGELGAAFLNTLLVTVISVTLIVVFGVMAAYPLARVSRRWSGFVFVLFLAGLLLPLQLGLLPLYTAIRDLGLLGSIWGLIVFNVGIQMPLTIFLYTAFLRVVPREFEEAAAIDGASPFQALRRVVFPMLRPVTGTVIILNAITIWNDFLTPLLYLTGSRQQTLSVAINSFSGQYVSQWNLIFASLVISIVPILILYFLLQGTVIKGFAGGLKG